MILSMYPFTVHSDLDCGFRLGGPPDRGRRFADDGASAAGGPRSASESGCPDAGRRRSKAATSGDPFGAADTGVLLDLQRLAGNNAVTRLAADSSASDRDPVVQRSDKPATLDAAIHGGDSGDLDAFRPFRGITSSQLLSIVEDPYTTLLDSTSRLQAFGLPGGIEFMQMPAEPADQPGSFCHSSHNPLRSVQLRFGGLERRHRKGGVSVSASPRVRCFHLVQGGVELTVTGAAEPGVGVAGLEPIDAGGLTGDLGRGQSPAARYGKQGWRQLAGHVGDLDL